MFSVIVPLYNKEVTIAVTLVSVLNQKFKNFEVIIINDGSTDKSLQIVESFNDPRISVFSHENRGVSHARNYAVARAGFEFISFLDADDLWDPNYLEEIAHLIHSYPTCSVFTSAYRVLGPCKISFKCDTLPEGIVDDYFEARIKHHIMRTSAITVKKSVLDAVGGFPEGMFGGEDDYTWTKFALNSKIAFTPKVLATYNSKDSTYIQRRGKIDTSKESWLNFYAEGNFYRNEFIASKAITAGIRFAYGSSQRVSLEIERGTKFTVLFKKKWRYLYFLNRMPSFIIISLKSILPYYKLLKFGLVKRKNMILLKLNS